MYFRLCVLRASFIVWAVGSSRNRANWQLTTLKQSRNVLRLITALALERRDVADLDPDEWDGLFEGCTDLDYSSDMDLYELTYYLGVISSPKRNR